MEEIHRRDAEARRRGGILNESAGCGVRKGENTVVSRERGRPGRWGGGSRVSQSATDNGKAAEGCRTP